MYMCAIAYLKHCENHRKFIYLHYNPLSTYN